MFSINTGGLIPASKLNTGSVPRISVTSSNNGIIGYYDTDKNSEARHFSNFISVNFFGNCFYHPYKASLEMKVHVLQIPEHEFTFATGLYITSALNKVLNGNYSYGEQLSSSDLKKQKIYILLPVYNDQLAFDYMENYVREFEQERVREIDAYLKAAGLNDYGLTQAEKNCIELMQNGLVKYKDFRIGDLFESFTGDVDLQNRDLTKDGEFFINSGVQNQGIKGRTTRKAKVFNEGTLTIDFFGNCYYRDFRYKLATHNHVFSLSSPILKNQDVSLYAAAVFSYLKSRHSFNNMLTQTILKNNRIILPVDNNDEIDYQFMELFISALKKLCIRSVVEWKDRLIKTAKAAAV